MFLGSIQPLQRAQQERQVGHRARGRQIEAFPDPPISTTFSTTQQIRKWCQFSGLITSRRNCKWIIFMGGYNIWN